MRELAVNAITSDELVHKELHLYYVVYLEYMYSNNASMEIY